MTLSRLTSTGALNPVLVTLPFWKLWPTKFKSVCNYERRKQVIPYLNLKLICIAVNIRFNFFYQRKNKNKTSLAIRRSNKVKGRLHSDSQGRPAKIQRSALRRLTPKFRKKKQAFLYSGNHA